MSKADIVARARVITDSLANDVAKAYARRVPGKRGPITVNELPEDVAAKVVADVGTVAPAAARKKVAGRFSKKSYALVGGGVITGGTLFNLDDLGFVDALLSLTPDSMSEVVNDAATADASMNTSVAEAAQIVGDIAFVHQMSEQDYDAHKRMMPVDRSVTSSIALQMNQVNALQALTDLYELALTAFGSPEALEAMIMLTNNTTPEDRAALYDNLKYRRGY